MRSDTEWLHFEPAPGDPHRPSATPIYQTATFRVGLEAPCEFDYTRSGNPTRRVAEEQLARLERGRRAALFASGMAAVDALTSLVDPGGEVLASADLYGGTYRLLTEVLPRRGISVAFADTSGPEVERLLDRRPQLVLVETPTNPFLRVTDLARLADLCRARGSLLAVDNSLMSPYLQRPLELGADVVVHSATKFLSGHADVTAGVVVTDNEELGERVAFHQNACGAGLNPFEAFLLVRGMKTLPLRLERQQQTAARVAAALRSHPRVGRVYYPGLDDHPGRDVHLRQARGAGSVLAFETGSVAFSRSFAGNLELFSATVSFGSVGSTVSLPSRMSHSSIPADVRRERLFPEDLVRLSMGIEDPEDLVEDVLRAIDRATASSSG